MAILGNYNLGSGWFTRGSSGSGSSGSESSASDVVRNSHNLGYWWNLFKSTFSRNKETVGDQITDAFTGSSGSAGTTGDDDPVSSTDFFDYLDGLITNQGLENALNRQYNSAEAALNRQFQAQQAQLERDWYEAMSSSAISRSMADMRNAGLNPILAYQLGGAASSGTGIPAGSAAAYTATGGDTLSSLLSSMADVIASLTGASASKVDSAWKIFKMVLQR